MVWRTNEQFKGIIKCEKDPDFKIEKQKTMRQSSSHCQRNDFGAVSFTSFVPAIACFRLHYSNNKSIYICLVPERERERERGIFHRVAISRPFKFTFPSFVYRVDTGTHPFIHLFISKCILIFVFHYFWYCDVPPPKNYHSRPFAGRAGKWKQKHGTERNETKRNRIK